LKIFIKKSAKDIFLICIFFINILKREQNQNFGIWEFLRCFILLKLNDMAKVKDKFEQIIKISDF
jgi:hypothetical protein